MKRPSRFWLGFLRVICPADLCEEIEGDLIQRFDNDLKRGRKASQRFAWNVLRFFRPGILLRHHLSMKINFIYMISHNLRFNARHLLRQKVNSSLHVIGLTLGMSVCLLTGLFLRYELSFDGYHHNADRIYRVNSTWKENPTEFNLYGTPLALAEELRATVPGLEKVTFARPHFATVIEVNAQKILKQERVLVVDPDFLNMFNVEFIRGDRSSALKKPYQALLTESTAKKLYGDEDPVGKSFLYKNKFMITVTGIIRDLPVNTNLPATMLMSHIDNPEFIENGDAWGFGGFPWARLTVMTFVVLRDDYNVNDFQTRLTAIADAKINSNPELDKRIHGDFFVQPLRDIHFGTSAAAGPWIASVNPSWLLIFAAIGLIVLTLACINFLNLSTAQAIARGKEVRIRKSIGAYRLQLIFQFLGEAGILTGVSGVLSMVIVMLTLSPINNLLGKQITFNPFQSPQIIGFLILGIVITSVLAGIYPAWIISRFNPVATLKSNAYQKTSGSSWLRRTLVVSQFTISAVLLLIVLVVSKQVNFMRNSDLGFDRENIVTIEIAKRNDTQTLAAVISKIPGVKEVSATRSSPISNDHWWNGMSLTKDSEGKTVCAIYGDEHFFSLFDLKLLSGRIPSPAIVRDSLSASQVVVNETLIKDLALGTSEEAVGKHFWWGGDTEIVGVVADFNSEPLHFRVSPVLIAQDTSVYSHLSVKLEAGADQVTTLSAIETSWKKIFPQSVYSVKFLDDEINSFYQLEVKFNTLFRIFAGLAILISCLGLWGLVTFVAQHRTKEIGIRKVLGASVSAITGLLSRDFVVMMTISLIIASPVAYYLIDLILDNFAYKTAIGWDVFVITGMSLFILAAATVSFQTIRAAMANPVNSLKSE